MSESEVSESESVRILKCQNLKASESESFRIRKCQNANFEKEVTKQKISSTTVYMLTGYSHLSDTEVPKIPTNSKAPKIPTVFWPGSNISNSKKGQ